MALETIRVQGADGATKDVVIDTITGQTYGMPLHKLCLGGLGENDNTISSANPLPVSAGDSGSVDAFGRWRVSNPYTLFDSKLLAADNDPLFWDLQLESGGGITASTPTANKPYTDFTSTLNTAGVFTRQTYRRFNYQPGKSQMFLMTGVLDLSGGGTGVEWRIGCFDDDNGAFFEDDAGTIGVTTRTSDSGSAVDTTVTQASWNLDALDGTGPSGVTADWTTAHIFVIDYQWLGVGRVRFGVEVGGTLCYVHETSNANTLTIPWSSTPNLPIRYQMVTTSSSPASTMRCVCAAVLSEGGADTVGLTHSHSTTDHINANTADTIYAVVGIRLKSSQLGCTVTPISLSMIAETNDSFEWCLIHNATVAGTFAYSDKTNSCCQTATGETANPSTNTVTGGTIIMRGFGTSNASTIIEMPSSLAIGAAIDGTQDTMIVAVRPLGANCDIQAALNWREMG